MIKNLNLINLFLFLCGSSISFCVLAKNSLVLNGKAKWDYFEDGQVDPDDSYKDVNCNNFQLILTKKEGSQFYIQTYCLDNSSDRSVAWPTFFEWSGIVLEQNSNELYWHYCKNIYSSKTCTSTRLIRNKNAEYSYSQKIYEDNKDGMIDGWIVTGELK